MAWYEQMAEELSSAFSNRDFRAIERWVHPEVVFDFSRSMNARAFIAAEQAEAPEA